MVPVAFLAVLIGNFFFFTSTYNSQVLNLKESLQKDLDNAIADIEKTGLSFENDVNYILYSDDIVNIFKNDKNYDIITKFKILYTKYPNLISNLTVYDNKQNVFSLYKDKKDNFLSDVYVSRKQIELFAKDGFNITQEQPIFVVPIYRGDNELIGNIVLNVELYKYFENAVDINKTLLNCWQVILNTNGNVVTSSIRTTSFNEKEISKLLKDRRLTSQGYVTSNLEYFGEIKKFISVISNFNFLGITYSLVYNSSIDEISKTFFFKGLFAILLNITLFIVIVLYYFKITRSGKEEEQKLRESEEAIKQIIEMMPIGIIIINSQNHIRTINKAATKILLVNDNENLIGEDISHRFFLGKTLMLDSEISSSFESDHFLHYEKDGNEIVIYKKDIPLKLKGEDVIIQSFIDVTPIEKSRKREITANMAKSEFLAKMSHEIRTPMNGIIGMADALSNHNLTAEQLEQVNIIRKSADLLLNILNDILDLSKIEAGKMILEEIPFKVREEIKLAVELFKSAADEKDIKLYGDVHPDVPEHIIGDPFRLRQIIINLVGNSIKFTQQGEVVVRVQKIEEYNRNLTLQFAVEDTGIGIPKEKLNSIFQSFTQADNSTTRKYGGTGLGTAISKQLVELMNGEIWAESPSSISTNPKFPGSRFVFTIEVYSDEKIHKDLDLTSITSFSQIKTLIIGENKTEEKAIEETLAFFNVPSEHHVFQKATLDFLRANATDSNGEKYKLLVIKDSPTFDGFKLLARMKDAKLVSYFTILMISSNDKTGNYVKSKRNGIDYYLIFPYETSEIYNFLCDTYTSLDLEEEKLKFKIHQLRTNLNILVAEDNNINQKVAKTLFKNLGYEVDFAKNGIEVLEKQSKKNYDIIFMDIMMPEMDGLQATVALRDKGVDIPIIAMTANIAKDERSKALTSGMNDYVTKPVRIDTVKKILIKLFSEEV